MSRILRDHRRLVNETMRQAGKAGERVQQRRKREERLDHRERRQSLSAARQEQRLQKRAYHDARSDRRTERWDHKRDASWLRTMARGEADPRTILARTDAGAQAFQRVRPELTGGGPAAGGAGGAAGGGGSGSGLSYDDLHKHYRDALTPIPEAATEYADTGKPVPPHLQAHKAAQMDITEAQRWQSKGQRVPPTAPEWHQARQDMLASGDAFQGIRAGHDEDGVYRASDATSRGIRAAFTDIFSDTERRQSPPTDEERAVVGAERDAGTGRVPPDPAPGPGKAFSADQATKDMQDELGAPHRRRWGSEGVKPTSQEATAPGPVDETGRRSIGEDAAYVGGKVGDALSSQAEVRAARAEIMEKSGIQSNQYHQQVQEIMRKDGLSRRDAEKKLIKQLRATL